MDLVDSPLGDVGHVNVEEVLVFGEEPVRSREITPSVKLAKRRNGAPCATHMSSYASSYTLAAFSVSRPAFADVFFCRADSSDSQAEKYAARELSRRSYALSRCVMSWP